MAYFPGLLSPAPVQSHFPPDPSPSATAPAPSNTSRPLSYYPIGQWTCNRSDTRKGHFLQNKGLFLSCQTAILSIFPRSAPFYTVFRPFSAFFSEMLARSAIYPGTEKQPTANRSAPDPFCIVLYPGFFNQLRSAHCNLSRHKSNLPAYIYIIFIYKVHIVPIRIVNLSKTIDTHSTPTDRKKNYADFTLFCPIYNPLKKTDGFNPSVLRLPAFCLIPLSRPWVSRSAPLPGTFPAHYPVCLIHTDFVV